MMLARNLKLWVAVTCLALSLVSPAPAPELYLDIIDMAAISRMTPQQLEQLAEGLAMEEIMRTKRSSAEALKTVAAKASSGIQSKVGLLGQASAFISSASSKSGGHDEHSGYSYEAPHEEKYDYWGLKKSILYTLFQAVKAITGGVTILKGQLIKGGGALAATLGKVISSKGDVVSNIGKKIVSSAALSHKKPHATAVYGPPHVHVEYGPPTAYGAPTAPGHYPPSSAPTGYAAHKYPASLDGSHRHKPSFHKPHHEDMHFYKRLGRSKLNGVHAGLILLTPLGEAGPTHDHKHPTSILNTFYSAIKNKFHSTAPSYTAPHYNTLPVPQYGPPTAHTAPEYGPPAPPTAPIYGPPAPPTAPVYGPPAPQTGPAYGPPALPTGPGYDDSLDYQPPPPPHPIPAFKPMSWGAVDSYGQPAATDSYADYDPRNPEVGYEYASPKHSASATKPALTPAKIQKINANIKKITEYLSHQKRSSEEFKLADLDSYRNLLLKGKIPLMPTPVVTDNELGVLSADLLPDEPSTNTTTTTTTTTTEQPQTTEKPQTTENENRRKDVKYILRGNKIVEV